LSAGVVMGAATLVGQTFSRWNDNEGQRLGAALAFYTLLSSAPLLLLILLALSCFYGQQAVEERIVNYAQTIAGDTAARLAQTFLESARRPSHGTLASVFATGALLFGASSVFAELRDDLNKMWDARPRSNGILGLLIQRAFAFLLVIAAGALMFVMMVLSTVVELIAWFTAYFPVPAIMLDVANFIVSFVTFTLIFALIYRFVPDVVLPWNVLWTGASVSALLFVVGKALVGLYLAKAGVASAYGAAGSVIAIAFWIYYSAQIFLLGAEFTYVWSGRVVRAGANPERTRWHDEAA
jgi:membrane protein